MVSTASTHHRLTSWSVIQKPGSVDGGTYRSFKNPKKDSAARSDKTVGRREDWEQAGYVVGVSEALKVEQFHPSIW